MSVDRDRVRALVREELEKRLPPGGGESHPALVIIVAAGEGGDPASECAEDPDRVPPRPCVIEPDRPCYNSGYCKRLGY